MIKPKRSLGQNFLIDQNIINKIIKLAEIKDNNIVEIGPGTGNLTSKIIESKPQNFFIIEKDKNLSNILKKKFSITKNFKIINEDILNFNLENNLKKNSIILGNLPYNISSQILAKLIKFKSWLPNYTKLILMFQKEVADKILAKYNEPAYGRLSVLTNSRLKVIDHFNISRNCFYPKPKVQSTILVFKPIINKDFKVKNINNLEKITHLFFSNKRKMINKALNKLFLNSPKVAAKYGIDITWRPNQLSEKMYYQITSHFEKIK
tara:strand:- start:90 stop:881 length:792 start_codon:yes stop_codon:yes gene_type:complete